METISFGSIAGIFSAFGPFGVVVLIWYFDMKNLRKVLDSYRKDMAEIRKMYENNVKLVERYEDLAGDLKDIIVLNTQQITRLSDQIRQNEYCPVKRVQKKTVIQEAGA